MFRVFIHHGTKKAKTAQALRKYDVSSFILKRSMIRPSVPNLIPVEQGGHYIVHDYAL